MKTKLFLLGACMALFCCTFNACNEPVEDPNKNKEDIPSDTIPTDTIPSDTTTTPDIEEPTISPLVGTWIGGLMGWEFKITLNADATGELILYNNGVEDYKRSGTWTATDIEITLTYNEKDGTVKTEVIPYAIQGENKIVVQYQNIPVPIELTRQ